MYNLIILFYLGDINSSLVLRLNIATIDFFLYKRFKQIEIYNFKDT